MQNVTERMQVAESAEIVRQDTREATYQWIQDTLVQVRYTRLSRKEKGLVLRVIV